MSLEGTQVKKEIQVKETASCKDEQICEKADPMKKISKHSELCFDVPVKTEAEFMMEHPISVAVDSSVQGIKYEGPSLDTPTLTQMDISEILNDSEYEDESDDDPCKLREHETESEDSSSDDDDEEGTEDVRTEGVASIGTGNCNDDVKPHLGCGGDNSTASHTSSNWRRATFTKTKPCCQYPPSRDNSPKEVLDYFEKYLDNTLFDQIVQSTNQTALQKQGKPLNFSRAECKTFFGIVITMSCINYPNIRMYWNRKWAIHIIAKAMTRDRFLLLRQSLKVVYDDNITEEMRASDQLWKVRPIINRVLEGCHRQKRHQDLAIDEMIIPLKGTHPIKQYCSNKPNPTGIKILVLANPNGQICDFVTYQGENNPADEMILHLTRTLMPGHILYFKQDFTTIELAKELDEKKFKCVGALMKNRLPKEVKSEFLSNKALASQGRGSHDVLVSPDGKMAITKWFDNKPMHYLSTLYAAETIGHCRRYDRERCRNIRIPKPEVVKEYDSNIAAVNLTGRMLAACHSQASTNKWTLRFMLHFIDLAISNSYIQYKRDMQIQQVSVHKIYRLWEFKRLIGEQLIESNMTPETAESDDGNMVNRRGRPPLATIPSKVMRTRGNEHLPLMGAVQRCRNNGCNKKTTVSCTTCKPHLCLTRNRNCFMQFHTDMTS